MNRCSNSYFQGGTVNVHGIPSLTRVQTPFSFPCTALDVSHHQHSVWKRRVRARDYSIPTYFNHPLCWQDNQCFCTRHYSKHTQPWLSLFFTSNVDPPSKNCSGDSSCRCSHMYVDVLIARQSFYSDFIVPCRVHAILIMSTGRELNTHSLHAVWK